MRFLFLLLGIFSLSSFAQAEDHLLRLYLYSAPQKLQWESPGSLARSLLKNSLTPLLLPTSESFLPVLRLHPNPLSHVDVELICGGKRRFLTGMSRTSGPDFARLPLEGMESFFQDQPGKLLSAEEIQDWWPVLTERNEMNAVSFEITSYACQRAQKFLNNFEKNQPLLYGGIASDPLKGSRAAGCAAFAYAFLEIALGPQIQMFQGWRRKLNLEKSWFDAQSPGRPLLWELLVWNDLEWPEKSTQTRSVEFFDPQLAFEEIQNWIQNHAAPQTGSLTGTSGYLGPIPHIHFKRL